MGGQRRRTLEWLTTAWAFTVGALTLPLYFTFVFFDDPGRGLAASISAFSITFVARYLWDLRSKSWFWLTLTMVVLAHSYLLLVIPWPSLQWGPRGLLPMSLLQIFLIRAVFGLIEFLTRLVGAK